MRKLVDNLDRFLFIGYLCTEALKYLYMYKYIHKC